MKKSKLLSVLTAGAVIATTVGTYAVWDKTDDSDAVSVSFRNPVVVSVNDLEMDTGESNLDVAPTAKGSVTIEVEEFDQGLADKLTLTPKITSTKGNAEGISTSDFNIVIKEGGTTSLDAQGGVFEAKTLSAEKNYTIEVTPKSKLDKISTLDDIELTLKAEISKKPTVASH